jgi:hypothetical protein
VYYELMAWARAQHFNNVPLKHWIEAFEKALAATLGHPTAGPVTIKHSYGPKTGMYPPDPSICIARLKDRHALRQSKTKGTHDERIPTVERTTDLMVLAEAARVPRERKPPRLRVQVQAELMAAVQAGEGEPAPSAAAAKRRWVEMPRTIGDGDTYDRMLAAQEATKAAAVESAKTAGQQKKAAKKAKTAARNAVRAEEHAHAAAERKAARREETLEKQRVAAAAARAAKDLKAVGAQVAHGAQGAQGAQGARGALQAGQSGQAVGASSRQVRSRARSHR